jgi:hypothetical protein
MKTHLGGGPGMSREMTQRQIDEEKLRVLSEHIRILEEKINIHETKEQCQNDTFTKLLASVSGENPDQSCFYEHQSFLDILVKNMGDNENKLTELNNQLAELKGPHPLFEVIPIPFRSYEPELESTQVSAKKGRNNRQTRGKKGGKDRKDRKNRKTRGKKTTRRRSK